LLKPWAVVASSLYGFLPFFSIFNFIFFSQNLMQLSHFQHETKSNFIKTQLNLCARLVQFAYPLSSTAVHLYVFRLHVKQSLPVLNERSGSERKGVKLSSFSYTCTLLNKANKIAGLRTY